MGSKGGQQTTKDTTSTFTPAAQTTQTAGLSADQLRRALAQPYSNMPMQPVAGFSPFQQQGFQSIQQAQGAQAPAFDLAKYMAAASGTPIDMGQVSALYSQMADPVFKSMQDLFGQQMKQTTGNDITAAGGVGASRIPVAQANLAKQQQLAVGQTGSGLLQQAINTYMAQRQAQLAGGIGLGNLAGAAQGANYQDISALLGAGGQQEAKAQQMMNAPYQYLLGQFQYPAALASLGAGFTSQLAPSLGGTTTGHEVTTAPPPNVLGQIAGLAGTAAGAYFGGPWGAAAGGQLGSALGGGGKGSTPATPMVGSRVWQPAPYAARGGRIEDDDSPYASLSGYQFGGVPDDYPQYDDWTTGSQGTFAQSPPTRTGELNWPGETLEPEPTTSIPRDEQGRVRGGIFGGLSYSPIDAPPVDQGVARSYAPTDDVVADRPDGGGSVSADLPPVIRQGPRPPLPPPGAQPGMLPDYYPSRPDVSSRMAQNPWLALMRAGLGTMAAASKPGATFLGSIGEGGLLGVKTLEQQREEDRKERALQESVRQHNLPYSMMTANQRATLDEQIRQHNRPYEQMTAEQAARNELAQAQLKENIRQHNLPYEQLTQIQRAQQEHLERADKLARETYQRKYDDLTASEKANIDLKREQMGFGRWQFIGPSPDGKGSVYLDTQSPKDKPNLFVSDVPVGPKTNRPVNIPAGIEKDLRKNADQFHTQTRLYGNFTDDFAGWQIPKAGDISNWIGRNLKSADPTRVAAAKWWQDYEAYKAAVRHGLYGSALTKFEIEQWLRQDINPAMRPDQIRANIERQNQIIREGMIRHGHSFVKRGVSQGAIESLYGFELGEEKIAPTPGQLGAVPTPKTKDEFDKLPSGTEYIGLDGKRYRKP